MKILETERLVLETLEEDSIDDLAKLLANERVHKFFPKTLTRAESCEFLKKVQQRQHTDGVSFWGVFRKNDQRFLGICGLLKQTVDEVEETEVAYRISDEFWGKGYGTEAAKGCTKYAQDVLKSASVISLILEENVQSIRVAEKNGLQFEKVSIFHGQPHRVYRKPL